MEATPKQNRNEKELCSVSIVGDFSSAFIYTLYPTNCTGNIEGVEDVESKVVGDQNRKCSLLLKWVKKLNLTFFVFVLENKF